MSKTQVYNYLQIAAILMVALMACAFNADQKANLQTGIVLEAIILAITVVWRIDFSEEIKEGI